MKNKRQETILELIRENTVDTQEHLQEMLAQKGFTVTQAPVSRDIRELNLIKSVGDDGVYKYRAHTSKKQEQEMLSGTYIPILRHAATGVQAANNLVVLKTRTGMGNAVGAAVDAMELPDCIGTLAGDDTLLIIAATNEGAALICTELKRMMGTESL